MTLAKAQIQVGTGKAVDVQFNPASLRVTTTNQFNDEHPQQVAKPTSFKLDVELLFDTTGEGTDVYQKTFAIRMAASATGEGANAAQSRRSSTRSANSRSADPGSSLELVSFIWGTTKYQGYIESLNETLDYWSSDGVPLRSTLQISLKGKTDTFLTGEYGKIKRSQDNPAPQYPKVVKTEAASDNEKSLISAAKAMGSASAARGVAALNGLESMRSGGGAFASVGASAGAFAGASAEASAGASASAGAGALVAAGAGAQLQAAAGFQASGGVSAGASAGFGMGASAGLSAGAGLGASVGVGMAAGASAGAGFSAGASAGFGASAGAGFNAGSSATFGAFAGPGSASFGAQGPAAGAGIAFGAGSTASSGGFSMTTSSSVTGFDGVTRSSTTTSVTGFDGTTRATTSSTTSTGGSAWGSGSAGVPASAGAFAGLGSSRTTLPGAYFNPETLLPPPGVRVGTTTLFDVSGRAISADGQVAAGYSAKSSVTTW